MLAESWRLRQKNVVSVGPGLRTVFKVQESRNNSNTTAEGLVCSRKYVDNDKADLPKPVEQSVPDLVEALLRGDGQLDQQVAKTGDLVTARAVRGMQNGIAGAATLAAAAQEAAAAAPAPAAGKRKGGKATAAAPPPPRPTATLAALNSPPPGGPRVDEESQWGPRRKPAPRGAAEPAVEVEADAPPAPISALQKLRGLQGDVARAYNTLGELIKPAELQSTAPVVGDRPTATAERRARAAVESMLTARRVLLERFATAEELVEAYNAQAIRSAREAGAVSSAAADSVHRASASGACRFCRCKCQPGDHGCAMCACGACCRAKRGRKQCDTHAERS